MRLGLELDLDLGRWEVGGERGSGEGIAAAAVTATASSNNKRRKCRTNQFTQAILGLAVDGSYSIIDSFFSLFKDLGFRFLPETFEDLVGGEMKMLAGEGKGEMR